MNDDTIKSIVAKILKRNAARGFAINKAKVEAALDGITTKTRFHDNFTICQIKHPNRQWESVGVAKRSPNDEENEHIGVEIARYRALEDLLWDAGAISGTDYSAGRFGPN